MKVIDGGKPRRGQTPSPTTMQTRDQKKKIIEDLKDKVARQKAIVFADFTGLRVKEMSDLRKKLKLSDNELKVAKKTLIALALKDCNAEVVKMLKEMRGEIAMIFGYKDEISPAKVTWKFAETIKNLKILGGIIESQKNGFLDADQVIELAKLPAKEELLGRLVGSISAPISNFVYALKYNLKGLITVLAKAKT
ncbi:MAG: 50S ribosomal protein L10 [Candidatus Wildermuthbacteria bacterium]|nr:50S ribosomal protein L10 [Candidatus Wildermuthbacteria bacterium]